MIARVWSSHYMGVTLFLLAMYSAINAERSKQPWSVAGIVWALVTGATAGIFLDWMGR